MNLAQIHLLIVHLPVLGSLIVLYLGVKAIRNQDITTYKGFYWASILMAITASIAYFTGPETAVWVKAHISDYNKDIVENHALWGRIGFSVGILAGLLGVMSIANYAQEEKPHKSIPWILLVITVLLVIIFGYTAHLGGYIRRPDLY